MTSVMPQELLRLFICQITPKNVHCQENSLSMKVAASSMVEDIVRIRHDSFSMISM